MTLWQQINNHDQSTETNIIFISLGLLLKVSILEVVSNNYPNNSVKRSITNKSGTVVVHGFSAGCGGIII